MRTGRPREGVTLRCAQCGKDFYRNAAASRKYCRVACYFAARATERIDEANGTARCAKCKEWKPIVDFVQGRAGKPHSYCKPCSRVWFEARRRRLGVRAKTPTALARQKAREYKRSYNKMAFHMRRATGQFPNKHVIGALMCEQDAKCAYCRCLLSGAYHIDHKQPVSRGGTNELKNLQLTCPRCNMRKGAMTHDEFLVAKTRRTSDWR